MLTDEGQVKILDFGLAKVTRLWLLRTNDGDATPLSDGSTKYSIEDRAKRRLTDLRGRSGKVGPYALATGGRFVYFVWRLDESDSWVMDLVLR